MTSEESVEIIQQFLKHNLAGMDPHFAEAIKKAIEVLTIDASKQKMKENMKKNA